MRGFRPTVSRIVLVACTALLAASPAVPQQQVLPPIARYTIDAGTISGMGAMGAGGGGGLGAAMAMLRGGNQVAHEMVLRLGSTRASTGSPKADHFLPDGMRMGKSVPLITPTPGAVSGTPQQGQMPKARLLLFWGCGEHAAKGQPLVIDFSKLAKGQVPPGLYAKPLNLPDDWSVLVSNYATYGDWPNARDGKVVPANASLRGAHRVASTYAPEINFTLTDDFMPPLSPTTASLASNAIALSWNGLPTATGYYAWAMGAKADGRGQPTDMVWWSSSATQQFGGPLADWLAPSTVARLVTAKTVMPPTQTSCTIPAEVKAAAGEMLMTTLYGYGPQADFAFPPRPANPKVAWKPDWIARVRFRANAMVMAGMPGMGAMGGAEAGQGQAEGQGAPAANTLPPCPRGLRGIAARAAKMCS
ncbi:MAG: hypothetical protein RLZZ08_1280 [Pseudomonadota bacterium]|jgi:hypothetical protein